MAKEFIVAIEFATSAVTAVAGRKNIDGSLTVLAVAQEDGHACLRKGAIYNLDRTMTALMNVRERLEQQTQTKIARAYVAIAGRSLHSRMETRTVDYPEPTKITTAVVNEMMDDNRGTTYEGYTIVDAAADTYRVDRHEVRDIVGVQGTHIEGQFLNVLLRQQYYDNILAVCRSAKIRVAEEIVAPLALAQHVLVEAERRQGCLLVDIGATTTTLTVWRSNRLQHLLTLPLGSDNITVDLATLLNIDPAVAEELKKKYGDATATITESAATFPLDEGRTIPQQRFHTIVQARTDEILHNVWQNVPPADRERLHGGIILTGGGAKMRNIEQRAKEITGITRCRRATTLTCAVDAPPPWGTENDNNTILALLATGKNNCAGESLTKKEEEIKKEEEQPTPPPVVSEQPRKKSRWGKIRDSISGMIDTAISTDE